jgi:hypothetical protein
MKTNPNETYYKLGYADFNSRRKNKRPVPYMYKLSYALGWYDAVKGVPNQYLKETK